MDISNPPIAVTLDSSEWAIISAALGVCADVLPASSPRRHVLRALSNRITEGVHDGIHELIQELTGETFGR